RFSSPEFQGSLNMGWRMNGISAGVAVNYSRTYWATNNNFPWNFAGPGRPAGFEKIPANVTVNLNASYALPDSIIEGAQLQLNVNNLLDTPPPKFDNANGYSSGNPIGRLVTIGVRKKW